MAGYIPVYLSDAIESIQRRTLGIIFPNSSYQQALDLTNLTSSLANRRILLSKKLMADMRNKSHPISLLAPQVTTRTVPYQLIKDVRAQKFPRTDFLKLATQKGNDKLLPKRQRIGGH